jgi:hypothetical protein
MEAKEMDKKFHEGIKLMHTHETHQDGAEILMELANLGHIDSIEQLVYIFLDQQDFDDAESYIDCAKDPDTPIILYLKARLIEERDGEESALESFRVAAEHGSPNAIATMFSIAIEEQNVSDAEMYFEKIREHENFLSKLIEPTTLEALKEEIEELKREYSEEEKLADEIHRILTAQPVVIELVIYFLENLNLSIPSKAMVTALTLLQFTSFDLAEYERDTQQEEFEEFYQEYEELFLRHGFQDLSMSWICDEEERALYITAVKVKAYQSGDSLARLLIETFDDSFAYPYSVNSGESIVRDLSSLDSKNLIEEWLVFVNHDLEPLQEIISVSSGEESEDYSDTESWFQNLIDENGDLFSQEGDFFRRRYGFSFWSDYDNILICTKCDLKIADCQLADCRRSVYGFSTDNDADLYCWTDPTGGAKVIDGDIDSDLSHSLSIGAYRKVPYIAGYVNSPIAIANTSGVEDGFGEKKGYATELIRDLQKDGRYSFKELNTQENDRFIIVAWIECQLGQDNMELFEKAMDSVKQYLSSESVYEATQHNFQEVFSVSLFAGHWELGFKRWLKSRLDKAMEAKTNALTHKVSKGATKIEYQDITIDSDYIDLKNRYE